MQIYFIISQKQLELALCSISRLYKTFCSYDRICSQLFAVILTNLDSGRWFFWIFVWAFDFCWFCVVIRFFHPRQNGQWPLTSKDFYTRFYPLHYYRILILLKEPVFPFSMLSAKQGNNWYHFYNVFGYNDAVLDWGLNRGRDLLHVKPALYH